MPAPSLSSMARRASIKNIRAITDVGDTPYEIVRPVLLKLENPAQLRQIEEASPQILGHDAEIWLEFVKRDVQDWDKKPHTPRNPQNWHKVYRRLVKESQNQIRKDAELLKATMDGINNERSKHKLKQVELDIVKLPEDMKRSGPTISLNNKVRFIDRGTQHGPAPSQRQLKMERGELDPNTPRRTAAATKGKLDQFRKDARAMPRFQQQTKKSTGVVTAREMALKQKPTNSTIVKAPRGMVEEYRQASAAKPFDPSIQPSPVFNPKKRKIEHDLDQQPTVDTTEEKEKRLKAFTNPASRPTPTPTIRPPRSQTSTPATASSSTPLQSGKPDSQATHNTSLPPVSHPQTIPTIHSPSKSAERQSPALGPEALRSNTSSPNNGGVRPQMKMKRKGPADIFMRPNKKIRAS